MNGLHAPPFDRLRVNGSLSVGKRDVVPGFLICRNEESIMKQYTQQGTGGETAKIAAYIHRASYESLPPEVVEEAKRHILDTLGAIVMAVELDIGKVMLEFARQQSGREESTIIGSSLKSPCLTACLVNGIFGHADELDDVHHEAVLHQGCIIVPSALALGEREKVDGKAFINAVVRGYDVNCRVCTALNPKRIRENSHSVLGVPTCFGAAATASSILGLSEKQICSALGLAGQQASGTLAWLTEPRHMAKAFDSGVAVRNGVTAALLAQIGFQGPPAIFEGPHNVFDSFSGEYNFSELTRNLGTHYEVMDTSIKKYPVGAPIQAPLEGLFKIMRDQKLSVDDIREIRITMAERFAWLVSNRPIKNISVEYLVAVAACYGKLSLEETHSETRWRDAKVQGLKEKIKIIGDPGSEKLGPAKIEVITRDGKNHSIYLERVPVSQAEVEAKFLDVASPVLGPEKARRVIDQVSRLEKMVDINALGDLLRTG